MVRDGEGWTSTTSTILDQPPPTLLLPGRPCHRPATQNVKMEVKHRLATIGVGVHHDAIALRGDSRLLRDIARKSQQFPEHRRVFRLVERADVRRRDDQEMGGCLPIEVL